MSRFEFVPYDDEAKSLQATAKRLYQEVEDFINAGPDGRNKSLALTALEESFMWVGKSVRDDQLAREEHAQTGKSPLGLILPEQN